MSNRTKKSEMSGLIIGCHPSSLWNKIEDRIDGEHIEIVSIEKL